MLPLQLTLPKLKTRDSREAEEAAKISHWWSAIRAELAAALLLGLGASLQSSQSSKHLNRLDCFKTRGQPQPAWRSSLLLSLVFPLYLISSI